METQNVPTSIMNAQILNELTRDGDAGIKMAQSAATNYTRIQIREDSFAFKILPPEKATNDMLDRDLTEDLGIIWEIEGDSPASKWVPLQTVPDGEYIKGSRFRIPMARVETPRFEKDIDELRTTRMDIRKVLTDNSIKDGLAEIDSKFIQTVNSIVFNASAAGQPNNVSGKVQWTDYATDLNRGSFADALKMLPRGNTEGKFRLRNYCCLMNECTAMDLLKLKREDVGGDKAQDFFLNGLTTDTVMGVKCLFTIKDDLVPDNYVYFFAEPSFLGKCFYLQDWTMYMKKEAYFISMFSYWLGGFAFGNTAGMAVARFNQPAD